MNISDYLLQKGITHNADIKNTGTARNVPRKNENGLTFANALEQALKTETDAPKGVDFSGHALKRLDSRNISFSSDTFERLNKGVSLAAQKGGNETLVLVDNTAFVVSVRNNKVITAVPKDNMTGNVFTNIDSTVII
jgi:flagellar operon protein